MIYDSEKRLYLIMGFIVLLSLISIAISIMALLQSGANQGFIQILGGMK